ncbi:unnamed protein product [Periconia digitata]|uniref:Secreted protein n=1 Tax=Periconia digitata TaxID=1303443 RepID=A0A9W4UWB0_9PLEO|nr:unnamed protein product [Periconia digitata]
MSGHVKLWFLFKHLCSAIFFSVISYSKFPCKSTGSRIGPESAFIDSRRHTARFFSFDFQAKVRGFVDITGNRLSSPRASVRTTFFVIHRFICSTEERFPYSRAPRLFFFLHKNLYFHSSSALIDRLYSA